MQSVIALRRLFMCFFFFSLVERNNHFLLLNVLFFFFLLPERFPQYHKSNNNDSTKKKKKEREREKAALRFLFLLQEGYSESPVAIKAFRCHFLTAVNWHKSWWVLIFFYVFSILLKLPILIFFFLSLWPSFFFSFMVSFLTLAHTRKSKLCYLRLLLQEASI